MKTTLAARIAFLLLPVLIAPAFAEDSLLKSATWCRSVEENQSPKEKAEFFYPDEIVYLSVELKGRPASGIAAVKFMFRDDLVADAKVDVADLNKGVIFSFGQNTFISFSLKPTKPLPIGDAYLAEVTFDGRPLGEFPFRVAPPKDALPSKITTTVLAHNVDAKSNPVGEAQTFKTLNKVVLAGRGDFGSGTWMEANWIVDGKIDPRGTRSVKLEENKTDVPFYFSYIPPDGWPAGEHHVILTMNGQEIARKAFTITPPPAGSEKKISVTRTTFYHDDGNGGTADKTTSFQTSDVILRVKFALAEPAIAYGVRIVWTVVKSDELKPQEIADASVEKEELDKSISGSLRTKEGLPPGTYRVDLFKGETVLASQEFTVTAAASSSKVGDGLKK